VDLRVLGGCGAWPAAGQACSGYLVEHDGFRLLIDPGYAVLPRLLGVLAAEDVDAVLVSHRHPDHCADLNPLLRARALRDDVAPAPPLPVFALPGALDAVLALDRPGLLDDAIELHPFEAGSSFAIGPLAVDSRLLPHSVPNAGVRLTAGGRSLVYTGDAAPDPALIELARDAGLLLAEASFVDALPERDGPTLSSARDAGRQASEASVGALVLTHLLPGTDRRRSAAAARAQFSGPVHVARPGLRVEVG
jgi:ribonuclease BN (tRNA processing enzyme)